MITTKSGIYTITCTPTGKIYVGSAFNIKRRWIDHRSLLKHQKHHNEYLQNAWNKHGGDVFQLSVIEECPIEQLVDREQYWVDYHQSANPDLGFNIAVIISAPMTGRKHSEETRLKMSAAQKGVPAPNRSRVHSPEEIAKVAAHHTGRKRSPETCARISAAKKGKKPSQETVERLQQYGAAKKGQPLSPEHRAKISAAHMGKVGHPNSPETLEKLRQINKGRKASEETRAKISATKKAYWEEKKAKSANNSQAQEPKVRQLSLFPTEETAASLSKITCQLEIGALVSAAADIHFSGDGTMIPVGTLGKITSSGALACNVHFEGYPENHDVLCVWDMLLVAENQPHRRRKIGHLPR